MGGCSYAGCKSQSENGFQMCVFPKDTTRRNVWLQNCKNKLKSPDSKYIQLCHVSRIFAIMIYGKN